MERQGTIKYKDQEKTVPLGRSFDEFLSKSMKMFKISQNVLLCVKKGNSFCYINTNDQYLDALEKIPGFIQGELIPQDQFSFSKEHGIQTDPTNEDLIQKSILDLYVQVNMLQEQAMRTDQKVDKIILMIQSLLPVNGTKNIPKPQQNSNDSTLANQIQLNEQQQHKTMNNSPILDYNVNWLNNERKIIYNDCDSEKKFLLSFSNNGLFDWPQLLEICEDNNTQIHFDSQIIKGIFPPSTEINKAIFLKVNKQLPGSYFMAIQLRDAETKKGIGKKFAMQIVINKDKLNESHKTQTEIRHKQEIKGPRSSSQK